jgi:hypothetical protein
MSKLEKGILSILAILVLSVVSAFAQSGAGSIQGTVRDATGAVVPAARIHIKNSATAVAIDTVTNSTGFYAAPSLFAGSYTIQVNANGMSTWNGIITLQVGQTAQVDVNLSVKGNVQSVSVTADETTLMNTNSQTLSVDLEQQRLQQLPMNGRTLTTLIGETVPGLEGQRLNGLEGQAQAFVMDGALLENTEQGGVSFRQPDADQIQEIRYESSNSSAKFDQPGTAILTTKSGTNQLHGSVFETMRNNGFGVARLRQNPVGYTAPKLVRNEFGGSVGGPVSIPHIFDGHDRLFGFFSWEDEELRQDQTQTLYVPTAAMLQGNFNGLANGNGTPYVLYDPLTTDTNPADVCTSTSTYCYGMRKQAVYNGVPNSFAPGRVSPLAARLYKITQTQTNANDPLQSYNWSGATPYYISAPTWAARADYHYNDKNTGYLRFNDTLYDEHNLNQTGYGPPSTDLNANVSYLPTYVRSAALGYTHIFSPTFYSETVIANTWDTTAVYTGPNHTHDFTDDFGLPNPFGQAGFPYISGSGNGGSQSSIFEDYITADNTRTQTSRLLQADENLTKIAGRHTIQIGARYRVDTINTQTDQGQLGALVQFNGLGTAQLNPGTIAGGSYGSVNYTGLAAADFYLGYSDLYQSTLYHKRYLFVNRYPATYIQDDFRARKNLTINLGIRWEILPAVQDKNYSIPSFDLANDAMVLSKPAATYVANGQSTQSIVNKVQSLGVKFEYPQEAGLPGNSTMVNSSYWNFLPRLGVAYVPFPAHSSTVLRGGFGEYIYPVPMRNFYGDTDGDVPFQASYQASYTNAAQAPDSLPNYMLRAPQAVVAGSSTGATSDTNVISVSGNPNINPGISVGWMDPNQPPTSVMEGNFTIEQSLKFKTVVRASITDTHGLNLEQFWNYNTAPSQYVWYMTTGLPLPTGALASIATNPYDSKVYGSLLEGRKTGYSNDYSAQLNVQRLYSNGLAFQFYYTFSAAFRNGGNGWRDSTVYPLADYLSGMKPATLDAENHILNYVRDTGIPMHRYRWNFIYDLPVGRGKRFLGSASKWLDEIIGGYQFAGDGSLGSQSFALGSGNWGPTNPLTIWKHKYPIKDCIGGTCYPGYQYFNGFISETQINTANGVSGLPTPYTPYQTPINTIANNATPSTSSLFNTNNVTVTLASGATVSNVGYSPGPGTNPYTKTILQGPKVFFQDISLFKTFPITEHVNIKFNLDAFNVFNNQGDTVPNGTSGIQLFQTSVNTARQLQASARISF